MDAGFSDFHLLERVTLIGSCAFFERAIISIRPQPNLRELTFQDTDPLWLMENVTDPHELPLDKRIALMCLPFIRAPSVSIPPGLQFLNLVQEYSYLPEGIQDIGISEQRRSVIQVAADSLRETYAGVSLRVKYHYRDRYYPPYLHNEPQPREGLIYDGAAKSFADGFDGNRNTRRRGSILSILSEGG